MIKIVDSSRHLAFPREKFSQSSRFTAQLSTVNLRYTMPWLMIFCIHDRSILLTLFFLFTITVYSFI